MAHQPSFKRAKTMRGKRHLKKREPMINENPKQIYYLHGTKCPQLVQNIFKDWAAMTKPHSHLFTRKRSLRPMEDEAQLESLSSKLDASLFAVGTSNKKRPNAITFARMFSNRLLDMCEVVVHDFKPMSSFKGVTKPGLGNKPCLLFQGHCWEQDLDFQNVQSMMIDFFRGEVISNLFLAGIDRVIVFSADPPHIRMQQYTITFKKSGTRLPIVELNECGPVLNMSLGRTRWAAEDLMRQALRVPKVLQHKKVKNIEYNAMGDKTGRIHMQKQELDTLQLRKVKALKKDPRPAKRAASAVAEEEAEEGMEVDEDM